MHTAEQVNQNDHFEDIKTKTGGEMLVREAN